MDYHYSDEMQKQPVKEEAQENAHRSLQAITRRPSGKPTSRPSTKNPTNPPSQFPTEDDFDPCARRKLSEKGDFSFKELKETLTDINNKFSIDELKSVIAKFGDVLAIKGISEKSAGVDSPHSDGDFGTQFNKNALGQLPEGSKAGQYDWAKENSWGRAKDSSWTNYLKEESDKKEVEKHGSLRVGG